MTQRQWTALGFENPSWFDECGLNCPVERVNWWEAVAYVNALSESEGVEPCYTLEGCDPLQAGTDIDCGSVAVNDSVGSSNPYLCEGYRLPAEAEWEYANRAGWWTAFHNGDISQTTCELDSRLDAIGWYCGNSEVAYTNCHDTSTYGGPACAGTHQVGGKSPNDWGLYDMSGNVWEWVWDLYDRDYYGWFPVTDPAGPAAGALRVQRGGSWGAAARRCRAAERNFSNPSSFSFGSGFRAARSDLSFL